ncbi:MAG: N-acetylneuraminate lyase [Chloroflexi bacterium]|nr:N-acetylneuraminate lyase [Chloroflexota bacterium]
MKITGLVPAVFTPMHEDGSLNLAMAPVLVEHLLAQGASALYVNGSTGEGVSLTSSERTVVAEAYVHATGGRVPVIIQVGHNSLAEARALAAHAQAIGADAISATPPSYFKPGTLDALVDCMAQVSAGAHQLPFYYYHIPSVTGVDFDMVDFLTLAGVRLPTLAGIKYSKTSVYEMQSCLNFDGGRYSLLFGSDQMLLSALVAGVQGAVGSTYNYMMPIYQRIWRAYKAGDADEAQRLQGIAAELVRPTYRWGNPALKAMMNLIGLDCGPTRLPQITLTADEIEELRKTMDLLGFFEWM